MTRKEIYYRAKLGGDGVASDGARTVQLNDEPQREAPLIKPGDRLWVRLAEEPSAFERMIADGLRRSEFKCDVYHLQVYCWENLFVRDVRQIASHLAINAQFPQQRDIFVVEIGENIGVTVPVESLMSATNGAVSSVNITGKSYDFQNQILLIVASRQEDHDAGYATLRGAFDVVGYLSLMFGGNISSKPIISCYFDIRFEKFLTANLEVTHASDVENEIFGVGSFFGLDQFSGEDDNIHASLWFIGKAVTENDRAAKIVFYQTAIEMLYGSKDPHKGFKKLYHNQGGVQKALEAAKRLNKLRIDLVHRGKIGEFSRELERFIQLMLLDAVVEKHQGSLAKSAFFEALKVTKGKL